MALDLAIAVLFFVVGAAFIFGALLIGRLVRPHNPYEDKAVIYECGERPIGEAWIQFNPRFYIVALIFVIFDVEIAFVFPIATVFKQYIADGNGLLAFVELFVFMAMLLLGLAYVWRKGDLEWVRKLVKNSAG